MIRSFQLKQVYMEWHRNLVSSSNLASQHGEVCEEGPVRTQKSRYVETVKNICFSSVLRA